VADRSVSVFLRANVTGFVAGIQKAKLTTADFAKETQRNAAQHQAAWDKVGKGMLITGGLVAAGLGLAVKASMEFQAQMAQVKSLSGATAAQMRQLTDAAKTQGSQFGFSAKQVAEAETELVKAGISVTDMLDGGLKGALVLAADGQMNVADATQIAASAMTIFQLKGKDIPHIADLLAAGADKALGSVGDLGQALTSGGTVAAQFGWSIEQTVGTLAEFAQNAQIGERGGTLLRQMLLQLVQPSTQAAAIMKQYGFSINDANGNMVDSATLAGRLKASFGDLSPAVRNHALAVIFGAHAIQGANILMKDGADVNANWVKSVNDSGFAAKQAAGKMDSLAGDVQKMKAAFQNALIDTGDQATGALRSMAKGATELLNAYNALSPGTKTLIVDLGLVVAVGTLVGGTALVVIPKIVAFKAALAELGWTARQTAASLGEEAVAARASGGAGGLATGLKAAGPVGALVTAGLIGKSMIDASVSGRVRSQTDELASDPGKLAAARARQAQLAAQLTQMQSRGPVVAGKGGAGAVSGNLAQLQGQYDTLTKEIKAATAATKDNGAATTGTMAASKLFAKAEQDAATRAQNLQTSLEALNKPVLDLRSAQRDYAQAVDDASAALKANGRTHDINTAKGRANAAALDTMSTAAQAVADQILNTTGSEEKFHASLVTSRANLIKTAEKMGYTKDAAKALADKILAIPAVRKTNVGLTGLDKIYAQVTHLQGVMNKLRASDGPPGATGGLFTGAGFIHRRRGGPVWGAGSATSDSVPAMLSAGEYVINAKSAQAIGQSTLHALNRYAGGGMVGGPAGQLAVYVQNPWTGDYLIAKVDGRVSNAFSAVTRQRSAGRRS
jgi:TP901 family phage tail tape measure protein